MPFNRPTPTQIRDRVSADVVRALKGTAALMRRSLEWVLVRVVSIAAHELHGHLSWISRQVLVDRADDEELERHAGIWGIARHPAVRAHGRVTITGVAGSTIAGLTELRRADDARFLLDTAVSVGSAGTASATVTAVLAGSAGNAAIGAKLTLLSPISGIQSQTVVADDGSGAGLSGGVEAEANDSLRARVLTRIQEPPHGGARHDYAAWVRDVVGETKVWTYPIQFGPGTVLVFFVMPDGSIPSASVVEAVAAHVEAKRPVTAEVTVLAPIADPLAFTIRLDPDTAAIRARVAAELADFLIREAQPGGTLKRSRLSAAISAVTGEESHDLIAPAGNPATPFGHIARLGAIAWAV